MTYLSPLSFDMSPIRLSYTGALRGVLPRKPEASFTYAQIGSFDPETLLCLAASNPEGRFYGIIEDSTACTQANVSAATRKVTNATFGQSIAILPPGLNYLVCEDVAGVPSESAQTALFDLAQKHLAAGGLFAYRYQAYATADDTLRFLVKEYAPNLSAEKAKEFLEEIKTLGSLYFKQSPISLAALEKALQGQDTSSYFTSLGDMNNVKSGAFNVMSGLLPRGFALAGDADIASNYLELAAPPSTHDLLVSCRDHLLYEPIKDFVLQRMIRNDVWVKLPAEQTATKPDLFGYFTFGITMPRKHIPSSLPTQGLPIDLSTPLFSRLIDLMASLPLSIGDFFQHPSAEGFEVEDVVAAFQFLVACGLAQPMRGRYEGQKTANLAFPVWANGFNAFFKDHAIASETIRLASPVVGSAVTLQARDALVLQALSRVGLANTAGALQPELEKIVIQNPALAAKIMDTTQPTDEVVHTMISSVLESGLTRWYAYGLLAA